MSTCNCKDTACEDGCGHHKDTNDACRLCSDTFIAKRLETSVVCSCWVVFALGAPRRPAQTNISVVQLAETAGLIITSHCCDKADSSKAATEKM